MTGDVLNVVRDVLALFEHSEGVDEPWSRSEEAFEDHFGASYAELASKVTELNADQSARYAATLAVNPEAAVLWVLAMNVV
jgi:hypothetical protein